MAAAKAKEKYAKCAGNSDFIFLQFFLSLDNNHFFFAARRSTLL